MSSNTRMARTAKLLDDKQLASVLVRLMMAVNDISVAYDAYEHWERTTGHKKVARREGGKLYYGRMMHSHVYEALQIIDEIEKSPALMAIVGKCSAKTQSSFDALAKFLKSSDYTLLCRIRNNTGFHYDDKLTMRMLEKLVRDFPRHRFPHSLGNAAIDWYFELGDLIIDNILVREICRVPDQADVRATLEPTLVRLHSMSVTFLDFAGYFLRHCLKR